VLKHAQATQAEAALMRTEFNLRMSMLDNGRGFLPAANTSNSSGLGGTGIQERAEALGGLATMESSERGGTKILVEVAKAN